MAAEDMAVTAAGDGSGSGNGWANAMSLAQFNTDLTDNTEAGDNYFIMGGQDYIPPANMTTTRPGSSTGGVISLIGVAGGTTAWPPTPADAATLADRPFFNMGAYALTVRDLYHLENLNFESGATNTVTGKSQMYLRNCRLRNTVSNGRAYYDNYGSNHANFVDCEIYAQTWGIYMQTSAAAFAYGCTFRAGYGIYSRVAGWYAFNVFRNCWRGLYNTPANHSSFNNTFYGCTSGYYNASPTDVMVGNIFHSCTIGIEQMNASYGDACYLDYNVFYNNGTDALNCTKGAHDVIMDPGFPDPGGGNYYPANHALMPSIPIAGAAAGNLVPGAIQPLAV